MAKAPKNRIKLIGIELEGGWLKKPRGEEIIRDGSVELTTNDLGGRAPQQQESIPQSLGQYVRRDQVRRDHEGNWVIQGEIPSKPLEVTGWEDWVTANYPKYVGNSCGLHVHMSFHHRLNYQRLLTPNYMKAMISGLLEWAEEERIPPKHNIWDRLKNPKHRHCAHEYCAEEQAKATRKDWHSRGAANSRYTAINYTYAMHKTVECRLLAMFEDPTTAISGIGRVLLLTNSFLAACRDREKKHLVKIPKGRNIRTTFSVSV